MTDNELIERFWVERGGKPNLNEDISFYETVLYQMVQRNQKAMSDKHTPEEQIEKLANFIMSGVKGEPSQSEGAVDCAIRLLKECDQLREKVTALESLNRELVEVSGELIHLHACEQEGLSSGKPTPEMWFNAVNKLSSLLTKAEKK